MLFSYIEVNTINKKIESTVGLGSGNWGKGKWLTIFSCDSFNPIIFDISNYVHILLW